MTRELVQPLLVKQSPPRQTTQPKNINLPNATSVAHDANQNNQEQQQNSVLLAGCHEGVTSKDLNRLTLYSNRIGFIIGFLSQLSTVGFVALIQRVNAKNIPEQWKLSKVAILVLAGAYVVLSICVTSTFFLRLIEIVYGSGKSRSSSSTTVKVESNKRHYQDVAEYLSERFLLAFGIALCATWGTLDAFLSKTLQVRVLSVLCFAVGSVLLVINHRRQLLTRTEISQPVVAGGQNVLIVV